MGRFLWQSAQGLVGMNFYQYSCCVNVVRVVADYVIVSPFVSR